MAKESRRRRANADDGARQNRVVIKLSDAELAVLRAKADAQDMSAQRLLLAGALADDDDVATVMRRLEKHLYEMEHQIAGAARNWNQIAKKANTVHEVPSEFKPALAEARALWFGCERLLDELGAATRRIGA